MSRFHDEFFRQKGPKHDKLMVKALGKAGIEKVFGGRPSYSKDVPVAAKAKIYENQWNHEHVLCWSLEIDELPDWVREDIEKNGIEIPIEVKINEKFDYETEVICKNGAFIVGYADLLITFTSEKWLTGCLEEYKKNLLYERLSKHVLVEIKPELDDVGAVLRQLKTYETILGRYYGDLAKVIVTYSCPDVEVFEYLAHEGIRIVVFEEGTS